MGKRKRKVHESAMESLSSYPTSHSSHLPLVCSTLFTVKSMSNSSVNLFPSAKQNKKAFVNRKVKRGLHESAMEPLNFHSTSLSSHLSPNVYSTTMTTMTSSLDPSTSSSSGSSFTLMSKVRIGQVTASKVEVAVSEVGGVMVEMMIVEFILLPRRSKRRKHSSKRKKWKGKRK